MRDDLGTHFQRQLRRTRDVGAVAAAGAAALDVFTLKRLTRGSDHTPCRAFSALILHYIHLTLWHLNFPDSVIAVQVYMLEGEYFTCAPSALAAAQLLQRELQGRRAVYPRDTHPVDGALLQGNTGRATCTRMSTRIVTYNLQDAELAPSRTASLVHVASSCF